MQRVAVVMAGGTGERFWPVSTVDHPKQLLRLTPSGKTLLQEAVDRIEPVVGINNVFVSTTRELQPLIVAANTVPAGQVLAEPIKRNTLGAVLWSAAQVQSRLGEEVSIAVTTADHLISPTSNFCLDVDVALGTAESTKAIAIIGVPPMRPETGYGYLEMAPGGRVASFKEKPDQATAVAYFESGHYLWNSGMFFFSVAGLQQALQAIDPMLAATYRGLVRDDDVFENLPAEPFDRAVLEKAPDVRFISASFEWDDIGAWDSLIRTFRGNDNAVVGNLNGLDAKGNVVFCEDPNVRINLLGVEGLAVVVSGNEVLVIDLKRAQQVRELSRQAQ